MEYRRSVTCILFMFAVVVGTRVPVVIWSNDRSLTLPASYAGHTLSADDFLDNYVNTLVRRDNLNIVLFVQNELSLEDIARHDGVYGSADVDGAVFHRLKEILSAMSVAQLPSVESPGSALTSLRDAFSKHAVHVLDSWPYEIADIGVERNLVIVQLPTLSESTYQQTAQVIDDILASVTQQMMSLQLPFVALYTAASSSSASAYSVGGRQVSRRQLLQSAESLPGVIVNITDTFLLYAENISIRVDHLNAVELPADGWKSTTNCSANDTQPCQVTMRHRDPDCSFTFMFATTRGYWFVSQFDVRFLNETTGKTVDAEMNRRFVAETPLRYSYHCYQPDPVVSVNSSTDTALTVYFYNLQIQAFEVHGGKFGYYNDCIGFFSVPIWMGVISTAVMLTIVLFGIGMLMSINTMDRYDDPKGKTITVIAAD